MDKQLLNFLKELKQYGIEHDFPNVTETGGWFLNMLTKITKSKQVLEIGCGNGYSTIWLADAVKENNGKIHAIDFSRPRFDDAKVNLKEAGLSNFVNFYFDNALKIIPKISDPQLFDFVFVDGEKRHYWDFWKVIKNRLAKNAVVVFDDVIAFPEKTEPFMQKIKNASGFDQIVLPIDKDDGVLLLYNKQS